MPTIRPSESSDLAALTAIYQHHVLYGTGTFEISAPSLEEMSARRDDVLSKGFPYLVIEAGGKVLGFSYCNWFKPRPAYRFSAENSIYLAPETFGKGWGRLLLAELCRAAESAGIRKLIAVIGDSANARSIGVHASVGFQHVGIVSGCGWKFDRWLDIVMMEKALGHGQALSPE
jgi:phosphinothricin acetyltransferase